MQNLTHLRKPPHPHMKFISDFFICLNYYMIKVQTKSLEWFVVKQFVLEELAKSQLFKVVVMGSRCLKCLMPLEAPSLEHITQNIY